MLQVKLRTDFVTNSSSSSFIVAFNNRAEMEQALVNLDKQGYVSDECLTLIKQDIPTHKVSRAEAMEQGIEAIRREAEYKYLWKNSAYYDMTEEAFFKKFPDIKCRMDNFMARERQKLEERLPKRGYISVIEYSDNDGLIFGELEHRVMPYLPFTVKTISHH